MIYAGCLIYLKEPVPEVVQHVATFIGLGNIICLFMVFPLIVGIILHPKLKRLITTKNIVSLLHNVCAMLLTILGCYIIIKSSGDNWFAVDIDKFAFGLIAVLIGSFKKIV